MVRDVSFNSKMSKQEREHYKTIAQAIGLTTTSLIRTALAKEIKAIEKQIEKRTEEKKGEY